MGVTNKYTYAKDFGQKQINRKKIKLLWTLNIYDVGRGQPLPEGDTEVTTGGTQQTVTPQENIINNPPGQPIREPEQDEEVDRPEDQQTVEVQAHHPYRLRKRANR